MVEPISRSSKVRYTRILPALAPPPYKCFREVNNRVRAIGQIRKEDAGEYADSKTGPGELPAPRAHVPWGGQRGKLPVRVRRRNKTADDDLLPVCPLLCPEIMKLTP